MKGHIAPNMIIGACEWIALPELGINQLRARVDTGAKTCALHALDIEQIERDGVAYALFRIPVGRHENTRLHRCEAPIRRTRRVKNTSGEPEERLTIRTPLIVGHSSWEVDITLTNRERMQYRMLLGRTAMENHALVYPARTFLQGKPRF